MPDKGNVSFTRGFQRLSLYTCPPKYFHLCPYPSMGFVKSSWRRTLQQHWFFFMFPWQPPKFYIHTGEYSIFWVEMFLFWWLLSYDRKYLSLWLFLFSHHVHIFHSRGVNDLNIWMNLHAWCCILRYEYGMLGGSDLFCCHHALSFFYLTIILFLVSLLLLYQGWLVNISIILL